jgi:hypothetical protein
MPKLEGITFNNIGYKLASAVIAKLKQTGVCEVYGLPRMHGGRGEVRLAQHKPDINHKNGRGVFGRLIPTKPGVTFTQRKGDIDDGAHRVSVTPRNLNEMIRAAIARREVVKDRPKGFEKAAPNQPGTVSGGQFESNRSRH